MISKCNIRCLCYYCTRHNCPHDKNYCDKRCPPNEEKEPVIYCDFFENFRVVKRLHIRRELLNVLSKGKVYYNFKTDTGHEFEHITYDYLVRLIKYYKTGKITLWNFKDI